MLTHKQNRLRIDPSCSSPHNRTQADARKRKRCAHNPQSDTRCDVPLLSSNSTLSYYCPQMYFAMPDGCPQGVQDKSSLSDGRQGLQHRQVAQARHRCPLLLCVTSAIVGPEAVERALKSTSWATGQRTIPHLRKRFHSLFWLLGCPGAENIPPTLRPAACAGRPAFLAAGDAYRPTRTARPSLKTSHATCGLDLCCVEDIAVISQGP